MSYLTNLSLHKYQLRIFLIEQKSQHPDSVLLGIMKKMIRVVILLGLACFSEFLRALLAWINLFETAPISPPQVDIW